MTARRKLAFFVGAVALSTLAAWYRWPDSAHAIGVIRAGGGTVRHPVALRGGEEEYVLVATTRVLPPWRGDARIVVRDVLGRETVLDQPFFTHTYLLEQGLTDWSGEIGAVRNNLGISSADYGQHFASGMIRHGISKSLTLEGQGEFGESLQDLGVGAAYALPFQALGQAALSASQDQTAGSGTDWVLGLQRNNLHHGYSTRIEAFARPV